MRQIVSWAVAGTILLAGGVSVQAGDRTTFGNGRHEKGSGNLVTEGREVGAFTSIKAAGSFDIEVTVGQPQAITLTFDDNLIDNIKVEVVRGELRLDSEGSYSSRRPCVIEISVPALEEFESTGSGNVQIDDLKGDSFECRLTGSGSIHAMGEVDELDLEISGSGDIDAKELKAREVYAKISGSGDIDAYAVESISGRVSGSGDIYYYGDPEHTSLKVSGSGTIRRR